MFLRITNKIVSFTCFPFVSYVDMCCFQDIKQLLRLAVMTNVWIIIFAWTAFSKFLHITDLHDTVPFKTSAMFRSQWLVILSQYLNFLNFPWNVIVTLVIKKQATMLASFSSFTLSLKIFFTLSTDMAVKNNLQLGHSLTEETDANWPFGKLKLVSHRVVDVKGNDHDTLWYFREVRTRCGHFL